MNIFVYSDESGVLDKAHNDIFAFGGLVFLSKDEKDIASRKYHAAERIVRNSGDYGNVEIKASTIIAKEKRKLYRSLRCGAEVRSKRAGVLRGAGAGVLDGQGRTRPGGKALRVLQVHCEAKPLAFLVSILC